MGQNDFFWDLASLYSSVNGDDYKQAIKKLDDYFTHFKKHLDLGKTLAQHKVTEWISTCVQLENDMDILYHSMLSYVNAAYTTDTTNPDFLNAVAFLEEKGLTIKMLAREADALFAKYDVSAYLSEHPEYTFIMQERLFFYNHQMSEPEEAIADNLLRFGSSAWSMLQEQIIANSVDEKTGFSFNELRSLAESLNRDERREAYKKEVAILQKSEIPLAAALNNLKGTTVALNAKRGWKNSLEKSLAICRISDKTLNALIQAMQDSLPMWRRYLAVKAKLLKIEKCAFYDILAPLPEDFADESEKKFSFPQAIEYVIECFNSFSPEMGDFARHAYKNKWIDVPVRRGKVGGAYCTEFPLQKESRVLVNFTGSYGDVLTLAHELGHAYHNWVVKDLDYPFQQYPMTLAETASIFAETIIMKNLMQKSSGKSKIQHMERHLSESNQVITDILSRFYFEQAVFTEREQKELTADDFCRLMADAQERTYGNGITKENHPYMWAVKSHYYIPSFDYYNFPYAFGLLFARGLYARFEKEGPAFAQKYCEILKKTGSLSCEKVCESAGIDITTTAFWNTSLAFFEDEVKELEQFVKSSK